MSNTRTRSIVPLWYSRDNGEWSQALESYWEFVQSDHHEIEKRMEQLKLDRIRNLNAQGWYNFLRDDYCVWKYTARNRYATVTRALKKYADTDALGELDGIRRRLLDFDPADVWPGLLIADQIKGLGTSGASGLLALLYPKTFGTVDQFAVKALREITDLPEAGKIAKMRSTALTIDDGVALIRIMQRKAAELNQHFRTTTWSPRKIDRILWTFGR